MIRYVHEKPWQALGTRRSVWNQTSEGSLFQDELWLPFPPLYYFVSLHRPASKFPITISDNSSCFSKNQQVGSLIIQHACITPGCCFKSEEENQHSLSPPLFQVVPQHIMCVSHMIHDMAVTYWDLLTWVLSMNSWKRKPRQLNPMKTWQLMYSPWWLEGFYWS